MNSTDLTPAYNLKVVIKETGIKPDTVRAWERRYGLPTPGRTEGGHRLYSKYDIELIKWLLARQGEGLSISKAVKLWRTLEAENNNPLQAQVYTAAQTARPKITGGATITDLRQNWIEACLSFNEPEAEQALTQAFALYPPPLACVEILQKGLVQIGDQWYKNQRSVQQEHFASALAMRRLNTLVAAAPVPHQSGRILIGCPAGEHHAFSPLLLTLLLRYQGWESVYLGADVPLAQLDETVATVAPRLVILTAQQLYTASPLLEMANSLVSQQTNFAFGGRIFNLIPRIRQFVPGVFLGETITEAVQTAVRLANFATPQAETSQDLTDNNHLIAEFQRKQKQIENLVWDQINPEVLPSGYLTTANNFLAANIISALTFDDMSLIDNEIIWLEGLLLHHNISEKLFGVYIEAYFQGVNNFLGEAGKKISDWLAHQKTS